MPRQLVIEPGDGGAGGVQEMAVGAALLGVKVDIIYDRSRIRNKRMDMIEISVLGEGLGQETIRRIA